MAKSYYIDGKLYDETKLLQDIDNGILKVTSFNPKSTIEVNATSYNIEDNWLEISKKYFEVDQENEEAINFLKAGFFGYFNEVASNEVKNSVYHRNVLYNEHFLNTASFSNSIMNFAKLSNIPILTSRPSSMTISMAVKKIDLLSSPMKRELDTSLLNKIKTYEIIMERFYDFSIKNFMFRLPYDVQILISETDNLGQPLVTAKYLIDDNNTFQYFEPESPFITVWEENVSGEDYYFFLFDVFQMESVSKSYTISEVGDFESLYFTVPYTNQLAYFEVFYYFNDKVVKLNTYFNNTFTPRNDEYFCYYSFLEDDTLQISFSNIVNTFRPALNSMLEIICYTTYGAAGNLNYLGKVNYNFSNSYDESFSKMAVQVATVTRPSNGKDRLTTTEMKQLIIENNTTMDNLITEPDLDIYFNNLNNTTINNSKLQFIKRRDDILRRIYSAFILLKDTNDMVIPSTTIPRIFIPNDFFMYQDDKYIPEYTTFIYNPKVNTFLPVKNFKKSTYFTDKNGYNHNSPLAEDEKIYFRIPYLIKFEEDPILVANYYNFYINKSFKLDHNYINTTFNVKYSITEVNIKKEIELEKDQYDINGILIEENLRDSYRVTLKFNSQLTIEDEIQKVVIRAVLYSKETNEKYGYFDFNRINNSDSEYYANLITNRKFYKNKLTLYDCLYNRVGQKKGSEEGTFPEVLVDEDLYLKIAVFYKDEENSRVYNSYSEDSPELAIIKDFLDLAPELKSNTTDEYYNEYDINDYLILGIMETKGYFQLFKNLSKFLNSVITKGTYYSFDQFGNRIGEDGNYVDTIEKQGTESGYFIEMLPVVGFNYFQYKFDYI